MKIATVFFKSKTLALLLAILFLHQATATSQPISPVELSAIMSALEKTQVGRETAENIRKNREQYVFLSTPDQDSSGFAAHLSITRFFISLHPQPPTQHAIELIGIVEGIENYKSMERALRARFNTPTVERILARTRGGLTPVERSMWENGALTNDELTELQLTAVLSFGEKWRIWHRIVEAINQGQPNTFPDWVLDGLQNSLLNLIANQTVGYEMLGTREDIEAIDRKAAHVRNDFIKFNGGILAEMYPDHHPGTTHADICDTLFLIHRSGPPDFSAQFVTLPN